MMEEYRNPAVRLQVVTGASPKNTQGARVVQRRATLSGMWSAICAILGLVYPIGVSRGSS